MKKKNIFQITIILIIIIIAIFTYLKFLKIENFQKNFTVIENESETIIENKTGYLFKNKDPVALADLIVMLMRKDYNALKSIGFEGRKNVLKRFDVDKMCQTTFTEYNKLLELS